MKMTPHDLALMLEDVEAQSVADMVRAIGETGAAAGVEEIGGTSCILCRPVPVPTFNRAIGLGLREPATPETIERIDKYFRDAGIFTCIQVSPGAESPEVAGWLAEAEFKFSDKWTKFYRTTADVPPVRTSLRVEQIGPLAAEAHTRVMFAGFGIPTELVPLFVPIVGRPNWLHYIAYDGDDPVAAAALYIHGKVAGLEGAATLPEHRGKGAQSALMARRIADAAQAGCEWASTETGQETPESPNPSYRNMVRLGFEIAYHRPNYIKAR